MLLFLYGPAGVGKTYVGHLIEEHFNFHFYDADFLLTDSMKEAIQRKQSFTQTMRDKFVKLLINQIQRLENEFPNIVISQGLYKEKNREQIQAQFPQMQMAIVVARMDMIQKRLSARNTGINAAYAKEILSQFEYTASSLITITNNADDIDLLKQLHAHIDSPCNCLR